MKNISKINSEGSVLLTPENKEKKNFLFVISFAAMVLLAIFGLDALRNGRFLIFIGDFAIILVIIVNNVILYFKNNIRSAGVVDLLATMVLLFLYLIDGRQNNFQVIWILVLPPLAVFILGYKSGAVVTFGFFLLSAWFLRTNSLGLPFITRLLGSFLLLLAFAAFYDWSRKRVQRRLLVATQALENSKRQTDSIMKNVSEGIFLVDSNRRITSEYSRVVLDILELDEAEGCDILELGKKALNPKDQKAFEDYLDLIFAPKANLELLREINPLELTEFTLINKQQLYVKKYLSFKFSKIHDENNVSFILVTLNDITQRITLENQLEKEKQREARQMETLFQIIQIQPRILEDFLHDTETEISRINAILKSEESDYKEICRKIFQCLHSVKGNAFAVGLENFARTVHRIEDEVKDYMEGDIIWSNLLNLTVRVFDIKKEVQMVKSMVGKISAYQPQEMSDQQGLLFGSIKRLTEKALEDEGKFFHLSMEKFSPELVPAVHRKLIKDILVQLTRNSIAHGFQSAEDRKSAGKEEAVRISISCLTQNGNFIMTFGDDGRGLDLEQIRKKAVERGLYSQEQASSLSVSDLARLIFKAGFSTARSADLHAGRGAGLDMVKSAIDEAGGTIKLRSRQGAFTEFSISLPA